MPFVDKIEPFPKSRQEWSWCHQSSDLLLSPALDALDALDALQGELQDSDRFRA
jgi:hypothetical protein